MTESAARSPEKPAAQEQRICPPSTYDTAEHDSQIPPYKGGQIFYGQRVWR